MTPSLAAVVLLIPAAAAWAASWSLVRSLHLPRSSVWPVLAGTGAYGVFQGFFSRPMGLYVFGHELTHALAAWLSGYRVKSMKVSSSGGEVITSDTNLVVALAPYCVPIYTVFVVALWALLRRTLLPAAAPAWCAFGVGLTFAFHVELTLHALRQRQPDLRQGGVFLSLVIILLCNGLALALLLKFLYPGAVSLADFGRRWWETIRAIVVVGGQGAAWAAAWIRRRMP
jgi:hypothetical protein